MKAQDAAGFGTSMLPFIGTREEVRSEPVEPASVRPGDILTIRTQMKFLVTHRVVKILRFGGQITFLTKGDNRRTFDPLVLQHQVVGRVVRAGKKDLTRPVWRWVGRWMAWVSYRQVLTFRGLSYSPFYRLWIFLRKKRWFSKIRPRKFTSVRLLSRGIRIRSWVPSDVEPMVKVWNRVFSATPTEAGRLREMVCQSSWFDPQGCRMVVRGGELLGWGLASFHADGNLSRRPGSQGYIDCVALGEEEGAIPFLISELAGWLRRAGAARVRISSMPVSYGDLLARQGFRPTGTLTALVLKRDGIRSRGSAVLPEGITLRSWLEEDGWFFQRNLWAKEYQPHRVRRHFACGGKSDRIRVALYGDRPIGLCQFLREEDLKDYSQLGWVWSIESVQKSRGYLFQWVVDPMWRGRGVGEALLRSASESLFQEGCSEISAWVARPVFYERFGFERRGEFLTLECP